MQQDYIPAVRKRDENWFRACKEIIDYCVAPDMYQAAMTMLDRALAECRDVAVDQVAKCA